MTAFTITCPLCGGAVTPLGWTTAGNQRGRCAFCYEPVIVTVHADNGAGTVNRDAPFYPLVVLIDGLDNVLGSCTVCGRAVDPRARVKTCGRLCLAELRRRNLAKRQGEYPRPSTVTSAGADRTMV